MAAASGLNDWLGTFVPFRLNAEWPLCVVEIPKVMLNTRYIECILWRPVEHLEINDIGRMARIAIRWPIYSNANNGVDAITFTAGVGENAAWLRPMVAKYLGYLGVELDEAASEKACGVEGIISTPESKVKLCVIPTNEELAIARETLALVK